MDIGDSVAKESSCLFFRVICVITSHVDGRRNVLAHLFPMSPDTVSNCFFLRWLTISPVITRRGVDIQHTANANHCIAGFTFHFQSPALVCSFALMFLCRSFFLYCYPNCL
ncbi:hypothetical protein MBAV_004977 [Candidatus Magnetobacterium bavaricum]|uniref:Uncharacterized protein n=1 Tax=Candidatus Magnetobacterium bavaricum TaxID=29290 RepID=A0A0F3GLP4_9BACT|nr:hypothetical protein MBAV_004977 [Candidatus Magnetobacterium bavaricum]